MERMVQKMRIVDVVHYQGTPDYLIWKFPEENFNTQSRLQVPLGQEAIFFSNGQAMDVFGPGEYTLTTDRIPLLADFIKKHISGGVDMYQSQVYYINKAEALSMKWGTPDKVMIQPNGVPMKLGAGGDMSLQVTDSAVFLLKLGANNLDKEHFVAQMREKLNTKIGDYLANTVADLNVDIFDLDKYRMEFSAKLQEMLAADFEIYGVSLLQFNVSRFVLPEDDPNYQNMLKNRADKVNALDAKKIENDRKMVELEGAKDRMEIENEMKRRSTEADADAMETWELRKAEIAAKRQIMEAEAMKAKRELEGYTYQEEQSYNIAKTFADKQGGSDMVGLGVGLGAMTGIGASVGSYLSGSVTQAMAGTAAPQMKPQSAGKVKCSKCGAELPENAKFCLECGEKVVVLQENEMICPSCGKATPKGKFCMECGAPLAKKCPNCGQDVPAGGKFCLECGTKIE